MIDPGLLQILRCPETFQEVSLAEPSLVEELNRQIANGTLRSRGGQPVAGRIDGGLVRADRTLLFPILEDVPVMILAEAIPLAPTRAGQRT